MSIYIYIFVASENHLFQLIFNSCAHVWLYRLPQRAPFKPGFNSWLASGLAVHATCYIYICPFCLKHHKHLTDNSRLAYSRLWRTCRPQSRFGKNTHASEPMIMGIFWSTSLRHPPACLVSCSAQVRDDSLKWNSCSPVYWYISVTIYACKGVYIYVYN